jgi:hypothetical protein
MDRRTIPLFRRLEQLMAEGVEYSAAFIQAHSEYVESLVDRADDARDKEREDRT